ncbi:hypothetical protein DYB36_013043 [Aphanomyces astaci]|uniref:Uncharacterized protein n=1 Tax=Aphanomyces astaci TaxID=112090 RepID=A0A397BFF3_APHAT|nr:hypothetical protein DYB36_013043 [Aphanomyces astaci]
MTRTWSINKETAMVRSVAVKKTTKGAALQNMRRRPTKLFEISGNYEEITHVHPVDTSSRNEVRRCGPRRRKSERGTHQPRSTDRKRTRAQDMMIAMSKLCVMKHALDTHPAGMTAACYALSASSQDIWPGNTAAGPVKVPGKRRCYVVNDGDEFLVSDDTLKTIGIDIDRLLEQVARLQVDEDGDDLEEVAR